MKEGSEIPKDATVGLPREEVSMPQVETRKINSDQSDEQSLANAREKLGQIQVAVIAAKSDQDVVNSPKNSLGIQRVARNIKNSFLYPSTDVAYTIVKTMLGLTVASFVTPYFSAPLTTGIHWSTLATGSLMAFEGYSFFLRNRTQVGELMKYNKVASPKSVNLADGTRITQGDLVGELHIEGANVKKDWRKLDKKERGKVFATEALKEFTELARMCRDGDERVKDIKAFYGISDITRPHMMQRLGFSVKDAKTNKFGISNITLRIKRISALGLKEITSPIGQMHEAWISREQLTAKLLPKQ